MPPIRIFKPFLMILLAGLTQLGQWNVATAAQETAVAAKAVPGLLPLTAQDLRTRLTRTPHTRRDATLVNLWATWCEPCKSELPELRQIRDEFSTLDLVLISADSESGILTAASFLDRLGLDFATYRLVEPADQFMKGFAPGWSAVVPTTLLFDQNGKRVGIWVGRVKKTALELRLRKLLKTDLPHR